MSYDFLLFKLRSPVSNTMELAVENMLLLGTGTEIKRQIAAVIPDIVWEPPFVGSVGQVLHTGRVERAGGASMEISFRDENDLMVTVSGGLSRPNLSLLNQLCTALGWTMEDPQKDTLSGANVIKRQRDGTR